MTKKELSSYFDTFAETMYSRAKKRSFYYRNVEKLVRFFIPEGQTVLEMGTGVGDLLAAVKPKKGVGIDLSTKILAIAREMYPDLSFYRMGAENMSFGEKFDYIIASDLVGYLGDVQKAFSEAYKLSHRKTRFIITYYNNWWEPIIKFAELIRIKRPKLPVQNWLPLADIENLLYLSGFDIVKKGKRLLSPIYIPLVSSIFNKLLAYLPLINKFCLIEYIVARPLIVQSGPFSCSVIIPCRNEKGNIGEAIKKVPQIGKTTEIIFVEGHSQDGTLEEIKRATEKHKGLKDIKWVMQNGKGKSDAVKKGFEMAKGDILMILDADLSVEPEELVKFYDALVYSKSEYLQGTRLVYPMSKQAMRFLNYLGNSFFSWWLSWIIGQRVTDTLCGTKVLFREDYEKIKEGRNFWGEFDPFGDFDLLLGASKQNLKILEIPIRYRERKYGSTNIQRFYHGWLLLKMCIFVTRKILSSY